MNEENFFLLPPDKKKILGISPFSIENNKKSKILWTFFSIFNSAPVLYLGYNYYIISYLESSNHRAVAYFVIFEVENRTK